VTERIDEIEVQPPPRRRRRWWLWGLLLVVVGYIAYAHWPYDNTIVISPETTYFTEPVNPDGTVNYVAALNRLMSEGVTPDNNAAVLLLKAQGPDVLPVGTRKRILRRLDLSDLPLDGNYAVRLDVYDRRKTMEALEAGIQRPKTSSKDLKKMLTQACQGPWSAEDFPLLAEWLEANRHPLALAVEASKRPRYYLPLASAESPESLGDAMWQWHPGLYPLRVALTARAMKSLQGGDMDGMQADLLACHRLARLVGRSPTWPSVGGALHFESILLDTDFTVATSGRLSAPRAKAYLRELQALPDLPNPARAFDIGVRCEALDAVMMLSRGRPLSDTEGIGGEGPRVSADWNLMLRTLNDWHDRMRELSLPPYAEGKEKIAKFQEDVGMPDSLGYLRPPTQTQAIAYQLGGRPFRKGLTRWVTACLAERFVRGLWVINRSCDKTPVKLGLAKLALALAACKAETGTYPETLDELKPMYIRELPRDLFSLQPFLYRRVGVGYALYSVGYNGKDDGGWENEDGHADDIVVEAHGGGVRLEEEEAFLRKHTTVLEQVGSGGARVLVAPALQGRVMAATGGGAKGQSFGIVNRKLVEAGEAKRKFNGYGGGDRIWLGPEAGPFGLFCPAGETINRKHWQTPAAVNEGAFEMVHRSESYVQLRKPMEVTNAAGTTFTLTCDREIRVLDDYRVQSQFHLPDLKSVRMVAYASENRITNTGKAAWRKETGLLSIWIVGVFRTSPGAVAILPFRKSPEAELGKRITDDYFGKVPPERLAVGDGVAFYRVDGVQVGKVGIPSKRSKGVFGSYDPVRGALTLVGFSMPDAPAGYVNYEWLDQPAKPYEGDAIMVYCSGPKVPTEGKRGGAYELETASPAAALAPGESISHTHTTVHITGSRVDLDRIARAALGVGLDQVDAAWKN